MVEKHKIGVIGEEIATKFLKNKGFSVLDRNYRKPWGELDIVVEKDGILHFIEVKSVSCETLPVSRKLSDGSVSYENLDFGPEDHMHFEKRKRLSRIIETYLIDKGGDKDWQVDLVLVYLSQKLKKARVNIVENIDLI